MSLYEDSVAPLSAERKGEHKAGEQEPTSRVPETSPHEDLPAPPPAERRDFLMLLAAATGVVGSGAFAWPVIDSLNPSQDVLALSSIEVDLASMEEGQSLTVKWRGRPVFVRYRTQQQVSTAEAVDWKTLRDPASDESRVEKSQYLIVVGICTHLGCVPLGQKEGQSRGDFGGWFCPCHGSHYDGSGRVRKGPAPKNLHVPPYEFLSDTLIKIG